MNNINNLLGNIKLQLENPWFLLVLIPAVILAFWPYFRMRKDKRRTRNRIVSMVLHLMILSLAALVLAGFTIRNDNELKQDETIILVDISDSNYGNADEMTDYINRVIGQSDVNNKVGVIAFGIGTPRDVVPLSKNVRKVDNIFSDADDIPDSVGFIRYEGTDIATALDYAASKFTKDPDTDLQGKRIIIMSDGLETDGKASDTAGKLSARGVTIDAVYFEPVRYEGKQEVLISDFQVSDNSLEPGQMIDLTVTVKSHFPVSFDIELYKDAETDKETQVETLKKSCSISDSEVNSDVNFTLNGLSFSAEEGGVHALRVELANIDFVGEKQKDDTHEDWKQNNRFYNYVVVQSKKNGILVINGSTLADDAVKSYFDSFLTGSTDNAKMNYEVSVVPQASAPSGLSDYGEVILLDVNKAKLPTNYDSVIEGYVRTGGGLLTMGNGNDTFYNGGMNTGKFSSVLPIDTKPQPTDTKSVMFCIDYSSGMVGDSGSPSGVVIANLLREGLKEALYSGSFSEDDYIGIMLFGGKDQPNIILPLTNAYNITDIEAAINKIGKGTGCLKYMGNTEWRRPLEVAAEKLNIFNQGDTKHIIFITDGANDSEVETSKLNGYPSGGWRYYGKTIPSGQTFGGNGNVDPNGTGPGGKCYTAWLYETYEITTSTVLVYRNKPTGIDKCVEKLATDGHGRFYYEDTTEGVTKVVDEECKSIPKKIVQDEMDYNLSLTNTVESSTGVKSEDLLPLRNFTGCTPKKDADTFIKTATDSIYVWWKYKEGKSGAFLTDVTQDGWAKAFGDSENGKKVMRWVVDNCFSDTTTGLTGDAVYNFERENFDTTVSVSELTDARINYIDAYYWAPDENVNASANKADFNKLCPDNDELANRMDYTMGQFNDEFVMMKPGLYTVTFFRGHLEEDGSVTQLDGSVPYTYVTFSYSKEYDTFSDPEEARKTLNTICAKSGGKMLIDTNESIFSTEFQYDTVVTNPQSLLMVIALLLFILDVCVRKFNFLWPHEIIRKIRGKEPKAERA